MSSSAAVSWNSAFSEAPLGVSPSVDAKNRGDLRGEPRMLPWSVLSRFPFDVAERSSLPDFDLRSDSS
eukprot:3173616-Rhodomonas_salina.1